MLVLAIGTAVATVDWDVTHLFFGFQILKGWVYILFELALDLLGLLVVMGLGMAVMEALVFEGGRVLNPTFLDYKIPTTLDVPALENLVVETPHGDGPYGARGVGEPGVAPVPAAIGNAISRGNPELEEVMDRRIRYCSLPEAIREHFLWGARSIVIAGTHGKTTTTALTGWQVACFRSGLAALGLMTQPSGARLPLRTASAPSL